MCKKLLLLAGLMCGFLKPVFSQNFCFTEKVYFASGEASPTPQSLQKLQDFLHLLGSQDFLIELTGHTDDVADSVSNLALSRERANFIRALIRKNGHGQYKFRIFSQGESRPQVPNRDETQRARNRRVELAFLPLSEGLLSFKNAKGAEILVSRNFFGDCPICGDPPQLTHIPDAEAAAGLGVPLQTTKGEPLITAGMVRLESNCKSGPLGLNERVQVEIRIPSSRNDSNMEFWNRAEAGWSLDDAKVNYDNIANVFVVRKELLSRAQGMDLDLFFNIDCKKTASQAWFFDSTAGLPYGLNIAIETQNHGSSEKDTLLLNPGDTLLFNPQEVTSHGIAWSNFSGQREPLKIPKKALQYKVVASPFGCKTETMTKISPSDIPVRFNIPMTDTTVVIKVRGFGPKYRPDFYFPAHKHSIPLKRLKRNRFTHAFPAIDHQLKWYRIKSKDPFDYDSLKVRYRKRKNLLKVKVKRK